MTKILTIPASKEMVKGCLEQSDGIILGIKNLSVNLPFYIDIEELESYKDIKKQGKYLFIMLNKNMHNEDLAYLKKVMIALQKYSIDGVFFYDIGVFHLKEALHISYPFIWSQEHLTTNAETCNYWVSHGVTGVYLSNEITKQEIYDIRMGTNTQLFLNIFGYLPMFCSKRHLVKNYVKHFELPSNGDFYYMEKENQKYPMVDDNNGTTVYSSHILNAVSEYFDFVNMNIDYVIFNGFHILPSTFNQILELFSNMTEENKIKQSKLIDTLCNGNVDKGFLYKETVYKIKGDV